MGRQVKGNPWRVLTWFVFLVLVAGGGHWFYLKTQAKDKEKLSLDEIRDHPPFKSHRKSFDPQDNQKDEISILPEKDQNFLRSLGLDEEWEVTDRKRETINSEGVFVDYILIEKPGPSRPMIWKRKWQETETGIGLLDFRGYYADRVVFSFRLEEGRQQLISDLEKLGLRSIQAIGGTGYYQADLSVVSTTGIWETMEAIRTFPQIDFSEPDYVYTINDFIPNDQHWFRQWHLKSNSIEPAGIEAPAAWTIRRDSPEIVVAVIDTGVNLNHEDLTGNLWQNPGEVPGDGIDNDGNGYVDDVHGMNAINGSGNPNDDNNHGSHVAGLISANGNNGMGVAGTTWSAQIMALKFLDEEGFGSSSDALESLDYAYRKGADIINASWGTRGKVQSIENFLQQLVEKDILLITSAGNEGINIGSTYYSPASSSSPYVIAVAAVDRNNQFASFSNYNLNLVDLAAPGVDIVSTLSGNPNRYGNMSGTSMAAPIVTGSVALLLSEFPDDKWAIVYRLKRNSQRGNLSFNGKVSSGGVINLFKSFEKPASSPQPDPQPEPFPVPRITTRLENLTAAPGQNITFRVSLSEISEFSVTWYKEEQIIEGASGLELRVENVDVDHAGLYRVEVENDSGRDFSTARLFVKGVSPALATAVNNPSGNWETTEDNAWKTDVEFSADGTSSATARNVPGGASARLKRQFTGPATISFFWRVSSEPVHDKLQFLINGGMVDEISGESGWRKFTHFIPEGTHLLEWIYEKDGSLSSGRDQAHIDLFTLERPQKFPPDIKHDLRNQNIQEGDPLHLSILVEGTSPITYRWFKDGGYLDGHNQSEYEIAQTQLEDGGYYWVEIENEAGSTSSRKALIQIEAGRPPSLLRQPSDQLNIPAGKSIRLSIVAAGTQPLSYQWFHNGSPIEGASRTSLNIPNFDIPKEGTYHVRVSNPFGSVNSRFTNLQLDPFQQKPKIVEEMPDAILLVEGKSPTISFELDRYDNIEVEWYFRGVKIEGATGTSFTFENLDRFKEFGQIQAVITSSFGVVRTKQPVIYFDPEDDYLFEAALDITSRFHWESVHSDNDAFSNFFYQEKGWEYESDRGVNLDLSFDNGLIARRLGDGESTKLGLDIEGPGTFLFKWRASTEKDRDTFTLALDGIPIKSISGETLFQEERIFIPPGKHQLIWTFEKDGKGASGEDSVWLDNFLFYRSDRPPIVISQTEGVTALPGQKVKLEAELSDSIHPLRYYWFFNGKYLRRTEGPSIDLYGVNEHHTGIYQLRVFGPDFSVMSETIAVRLAEYDRTSLSAILGTNNVKWSLYGNKNWVRSIKSDAYGGIALTPESMEPGDVAGLKGTIEAPASIRLDFFSKTGSPNNVLSYQRDDTSPKLNFSTANGVVYFNVPGTGPKSFYIEYNKGEEPSTPEEEIWIGRVQAKSLKNGPAYFSIFPKEIYYEPNFANGIGVDARSEKNISYQWYEGYSGDTSNPLPDSTLAVVYNRNLTENRAVWARATDENGHVDSETAFVFVDRELQIVDRFIETFEFEEVDFWKWTSPIFGTATRLSGDNWLEVDYHGFWYIPFYQYQGFNYFWVYDLSLGYILVEKGRAPEYFYSSHYGEWMYYLPNSKNPRWFYLYSEKRWMAFE